MPIVLAFKQLLFIQKGSQMDQFMLLLVGIIPLLLVVLGLLICGMSGFCFPASAPSEQRYAVGIAAILILLGILGIVWKNFVFLYPALIMVARLYFAGAGLYRVFKKA
jgi:hypothetical protein